MRSPNRTDERGGIRRTETRTNMRSMSIAANMSNGETPTDRLTFFCRRSAFLMKTIAIPVLIFVLAVVVAGCRSDPTLPAATSGADVETPTVTSTRDISSAGQAASTRTTPDPSGEAGQMSDAGPTSRPEPTVAPATPIPSPTAPAATPATPTRTAEPVPTSTPSVVRVSRSSLERETAPDVSEGDLETLVEGNNTFAFDLYHSLVDAEGNLFFSPHSISAALAMAYAGARGDTERQMAETLQFNLAQDRLHAAFNALDLSLVSQDPAGEGEDFRLSVANSVWGQENYGFLQEFLDTLALNYGDEVRPVDFQSNAEGARAQINDWVSDATEERIMNLVPRDAIDQYTRMVLANAIYFKAAWQHTFDERATADLPFHLLDGSEREVAMMRQQENLRHAQGDGYQVVELPYGRGDVAMTILLPDSGRFREFEESLTGESVAWVLDGLNYTPVRLTMPKFEMESTLNLSDKLKAMGMPDAFDDQAANFSGMDGQICRSRGDICLLISDVLHKAFVSVDEAGTEAAAATAVIVGVTRGVVAEPEPVEMVVDRPFVFLIRDRTTGTLLFVGRMLEP